MLQLPRRRIAAALVLLGLASCGGGSDGSVAPLPIPTPPAAGTIGDGRLPELIEWARASQGLPAMAVAIVRNGQIVEQAAVGRRATSGNTAVTTDDRWHLGSLTKAVTSTLAAVLVEQSVITWDTTPLDVWPELAASIHPGFRNVTLRQLLSHSSGLVRDSAWSGAEDSALGTLVEKRRAWAARVLAQAPAVSAGEYLYSNIAYVVAGAMLETRTGTPWETMLTEQVFGPLGMNESGFGAPGQAAQADQPWGHWGQGASFDAVAPGAGADNPQSVGPAGTMHASLADYARFMVAHIDGARGMPGLVSASMFKTLHTPLAGGYAFGWGVASNLPLIGDTGLTHDGSNLRWYARVWLSPSRNAGVVLVTNAGSERAAAAITALDQQIRSRFVASQ